MDAIEPVNDLLIGLLARPRERSSWALIAKMASSPTGPSFFLGNLIWLEKAATNPKEVLGVLMVVIAVPAAKTKLFSSQQCTNVLRLNCRLGDPSALRAVGAVIARAEVSASMLRRLQAEGFWTLYLEAVAQLPRPDVQQSWMAVVEAFCKVGWIDEFGLYLKHLCNLMAVPEVALLAIRVIGTVTRYQKQSARVMGELKLVAYFENLRGNQYYGNDAEVILANVKAALGT
jgi:hypothetical protein